MDRYGVDQHNVYKFVVHAVLGRITQEDNTTFVPLHVLRRFAAAGISLQHWLPDSRRYSLRRLSNVQLFY